MAVEVFSDDLLPSSSGTTRNSVLNAPSSFHEAFAARITSPASTLRQICTKKKRGPRAKHLSRTVSTPPPRSSAMSESGLDKKRNKLGYQRISIACAHCRRRKIRCLLADKDPQGRCSNCIRLKKECVFYPIDQQAAYETRSDQGSRRGVGSASSSGVSSTSPDLQIRRSQFPPLTQHTMQGFRGMLLEPGATFQGERCNVPREGAILKRVAGHYLSTARSYTESLHSNSPWLPPTTRDYELQAQIRNATPQHPQYCAYEQSPGSADFTPFPNDSAQQVRTPSTFSTATFPQSSPEQQWQLQQPSHAMRSLSFPLPTASVPANLPDYGHTYITDSPRQLPDASHPPFSVPPEGAPMTRPMRSPPFSTPLPQSHLFSEHGGTYQEHPHGTAPVQQGYPVNWLPQPQPGGLGFWMEEQSSTPSNTLPPYVVPSQRPR